MTEPSTEDRLAALAARRTQSAPKTELGHPAIAHGPVDQADETVS